MPIYEYECTACGQSTEKLQKLNDPPLTDCPHCGASRLQKRVSAAGFRLTGGGWYETDFKTKKKKNLAEGSEPAAKPEAKNEAAKTEKSADAAKPKSQTSDKSTKASKSSE